MFHCNFTIDDQGHFLAWLSQRSPLQAPRLDGRWLDIGSAEDLLRAQTLIERGYAPDDIYLSLERNMSCGVGKCGRCQINGLYACQDGPVFKYADIANIREAI